MRDYWRTWNELILMVFRLIKGQKIGDELPAGLAVNFGDEGISTQEPESTSTASGGLQGAVLQG